MPRSPAAELVQQVIRVAVLPTMKALGLRKTGTTFRKNLPECIQVLNVQSSSSNSSAEARFTINLGIYFPAVQRLGEGLAGGTPGPAGPLEYECTIRTRIGSLLPDHDDRWWTVRPGEPTDEVIRAVQDATRDHAVPWLDRCAVLENAREEAPPPVAMVLALMLNDLASAKAIATRFALERPYATGVTSWARRHGLLDEPPTGASSS